MLVKGRGTWDRSDEAPWLMNGMWELEIESRRQSNDENVVNAIEFAFEVLFEMESIVIDDAFGK